MPTLFLRGSNAFPSFRLRQLEDSVSAKLNRPLSISAKFIYMLDTADALPKDALKRACELLGASEPDTASPENTVYVSPRKGTISPWSSKATDIFHN